MILKISKNYNVILCTTRPLPIIGSFLREDTLLDGVVKDLTLLAAELADVLGEVACDELLTTVGTIQQNQEL
jgi:hypothetical protein